MTRRDIRAQRRAAQERRMWTLPSGTEPDARERLVDVLEDVFRALDEDRRRAEQNEPRNEHG